MLASKAPFDLGSFDALSHPQATRVPQPSVLGPSLIGAMLRGLKKPFARNARIGGVIITGIKQYSLMRGGSGSLLYTEKFDPHPFKASGQSATSRTRLTSLTCEPARSSRTGMRSRSSLS